MSIRLKFLEPTQSDPSFVQKKTCCNGAAADLAASTQSEVASAGLSGV